MKEFTYLHISDLHFGNKFSSPYWSNIKGAFYKDLDYIHGKLLKNIDVIFITGDVAQTGDVNDFSKFWDFIKECFAHLGISNDERKPKLLFVPGNHDLFRCDKESKPELQMMKQWNENEDLRNQYFWETGSEYLSFVNSCFANYAAFVDEVDKKQGIKTERGLLVGDYYTSLDLNGIKLGVVGLNSSFLQLSAGNYQHKLGVYLKQLNAILGKEYGEKLRENDFCILLTHHAPDWYSSESLKQYNTEIYSQGKFLEHYCGHNHVAQSTISSANHSSEKRVYVGHSLFGVEFEDKDVIRIHGYEAGKYILSDNGVIDKVFYPRLAFQKADGWDFDKDTNFSYSKGEECIHLSLRKIADKDIIQSLDSIGGDVLGDERITTKIPSVSLKDARAHAFVRAKERELGMSGLQKERFLWITTHYGLCSERFISSILESSNRQYNVFCLNIGDCNSVEDVENQVKDQFGEPFNVFVDDISKSYDNPLLLLRGISNDFVKEHAEKLCKWIESALIFKKNLSAIVVSNLKYEREALTVIDLNPLPLDEVKIYVEHTSKQNSWGIMEWEKIHSMSGGYPLFIDMILHELQFVDIDDLNVTDYVSNGEIDNIPIAIQTYIRDLRSSSIKEDNRKFQLLYLLSSLPKGESFSSIKRFNPCVPFYPSDIAVLQEHELLMVDYYYYISKDKKDIIPTKVLSVPTIYRNFVCGLENDESKEFLYERICEMYLGAKWKTDRITFQKKGEQRISSSANNNISSSLSFLVRMSLSNITKLNRYLHIAGCFVLELENMGLFYAGCVAAKEIYDLVKDEDNDDSEFRNNRAYLKYEYASSLRMMRYEEESKTLFTELLQESILPKSKLQSCRESLAYLSSGVDAKWYAEEMIRNEKNDKSLVSLIGHYITSLDESNPDLKRRNLSAIHREVKKKFPDTTLMANVTISLSYVDEVDKSIRAIDYALGVVKDSYSRMRLVSRKYNLVMTKEQPTLQTKDIEAVRCVYTYSFTQMLPNLLAPAHRILWDYYMGIHDYQQVAMLYKCSNFVWTIKEDERLQQEFKDKVANCPDLVQWMREHRNDIDM